MADVLLTVGVNPNIDFSQFEKDLDAVFSKYEKSSKKRTIDVEFTLSSAAQSSLDSDAIHCLDKQSTVELLQSMISMLQGKEML